MTDMMIEQRLARLELSARRWRRGCVGLAVAGLLAVGGGAMQMPKPGVVKATKLVIVDRNGDPVIVLATDAFGSAPSIELLNPDTKFSVARIEADGDNATLNLGTGKAEARVEIGVVRPKDGSRHEPFVRLTGWKGAERPSLNVDRLEKPRAD